MFESLIGLLTALLEILSRIKMNKSDKQNIGRSIAKIYTGLIEINENGGEILQYLGRFENAKRVLLADTKLIKLLNEQSTRIKNIRKVIDNSRITTILKIHLPQIADMQVLLQIKANVIAILTEQLNVRGMKKFRPVNMESLYMYISGRDHPLILVLPTIKQLDNAYRNLDELKRLTEILRHFLIKNFDINEII